MNKKALAPIFIGLIALGVVSVYPTTNYVTTEVKIQRAEILSICDNPESTKDGLGKLRWWGTTYPIGEVWVYSTTYKDIDFLREDEDLYPQMEYKGGDKRLESRGLKQLILCHRRLEDGICVSAKGYLLTDEKIREVEKTKELTYCWVDAERMRYSKAKEHRLKNEYNKCIGIEISPNANPDLLSLRTVEKTTPNRKWTWCLKPECNIICGKIGTPEEGWYDDCTMDVLKLEGCSLKLS